MTKLDFRTKVLDIVSQIKSGEALSYGEVAKRAGSSGAARAVGRILSKNFDPDIPCHRVVYCNGRVGGYNRGEAEKIRCFKQENVKLVFG